MSSTYNLIVSSPVTPDGKSLQVSPGAAEKGNAIRLKAETGSRFQLQNAQTSKLTGPDNLRLRRVGNDLEIMLDQSSKADIVIQDYFSVITQPTEGLMGTNASGALQSYVPVQSAGVVTGLDAASGQIVNATLAGPTIAQLSGGTVGLLAPAGFPMAGVAAGAAAVAVAAGAAGGSNAPQAPRGASKTIQGTEDNPYTITKADFGFADADGNSFTGVKITALPTNGTLTLDGKAVTANQVISIADIDAGKLVFKPAANANGTGATLEFKVQDNGASNNEATTASKLTFDLAAVNDAATISGTAKGDVYEDGISATATAAQASNTATGSLNVSDVDTGEAAFQIPESLNGTYGTFTFDATKGDWTYKLDNGRTSVQALTAGQKVHDKLTVKSLDGTASKTIEITITGSNDVATVSVSPVLSSLVEGAQQNTVSGQAVVADADTGENRVQIQTNTAGEYGSFSIGADGHWTYTLNNDSPNVKALTAGKVVSDTFTVKSADGSAGQGVVVQITGTNNAAAITGQASGAVTEDAQTNTATGKFDVSDVDTGEAEVVAQTNVAGTYGTFSIGTNGQWTYTLDNSKANVQALAQGATVTDAFAVTSKDGTATQNVVVTITGANDVAQISGATTGNVTEDAQTTTATGTLNVADLDTGETQVVAQSNAAGTYGTFSINAAGQWTYTLDNSKANVQALAKDAKVTDTFAVTSKDGTATRDVVVTITGANDAAQISGTATGNVTEDATANTATGTLSVSDVDTGEAEVVAQCQ